MLNYIFILGSNWILSLSELDIILQREEYKGKIKDYSACAAIVEFEQGELTLDKISELQYGLGGIQKICKGVDFIDTKSFLHAFPEKIGEEHPGFMIDGRKYVEGILRDACSLVFGKIEKENYFVANSIYPTAFSSPYYQTLLNYFLHFVNRFWEDYLKERGAKKVTYYQYPKENIEKGNLNPIFPHHFTTYELFKPTRKEVVYTFTEEGVYIGYTLVVTNAEDMKTIDEDRPYIDPKASIPPKFGLMMINYLNLKRPYPNARILDPFCGSGTILLFGFMQRIQIFGTDERAEAVQGTKDNLKWISERLENPLKINWENNIKRASIKEVPTVFQNFRFHGIVTEPILLPYFRSKPDQKQIERLFQSQTIPTYVEAFKTFKIILRPNARVAITAPSVLTSDGGRIRLNLRDIAENEGFRLVKLLNNPEFTEKTDKNLRLETKSGVLFDNNTKFLRREFYLFENQNEKTD